MPTFRSQESEPLAVDVSSTTAGLDRNFHGPLASDQIQRWAALIADGSSEFPEELAAPDRERLVAEVRGLLRARLVTLVAKAIAREFYRRERGQDDHASDTLRGPVPRGHEA